MRSSRVFFVAALLLAGCGGNDTLGPTLAAPGGITVAVSPINPATVPGGHIQFVATVTGNANTAVTWSVAPAGGPGQAPAIDANGLFTAGTAIGTYTVTATSVANDSIFARTMVTVNAAR